MTIFDFMGDHPIISMILGICLINTAGETVLALVRIIRRDRKRLPSMPDEWPFVRMKDKVEK